MKKNNYKKLMAYALCSALTLNSPVIVKAQESSIETQDKDVYVKATDNVIIRSEATIESSRIGLLNHGQKLKYIDETDDFYEVEYNNSNGYVSKDYSMKIEQAKDYDSKKMVIVLDDTLMYSDEGPVDVEKYTIGELLEENDSYYGIKTDDKQGFVDKNVSDILTDTYVIVDISDQNLKLYDKGEVIVDTPVVTGTYNTKRETTRGYFSIFQIRHNTDLIGPGYRSHVDVMMKFHNNEGIHDANRWRSEYGGEIYKTNGSHGCVNTPHDAAIEVSNHVELGTKVLVKD